MKLRIAINATPLLAPLTGIGNYILHLGRALEQGGEVELVSFYGYRVRAEAPRVDPRFVVARQRSLAWKLARRVIPFKHEMRQLQQRLAFAQTFRRGRVDLYHEPNYVPVRYEVPVVTTVHDLSWLHFPDMHPAARVRWLSRGFPKALERSAALLVDSEFIRDELVSTFSLAPERVYVAPLGVSEAFGPHVSDEAAPVLVRHGLRHRRYVLVVGTIEPRKNLRHALQAYALLPERLRAEYPLVVAGAPGWHASDLERELALLSRERSVRFLGFVGDSDLPALYAGAAVFVFPSLYEGFGLPVLEAMASGIAVLASNRSSIPEVLGDAGVLIDPDDAEATAAALLSLLEDEAGRTALGQRATDRARRFSWPACAHATLRAYRAATH